MDFEKETIKRIHLKNKGFIWYYEICDNPDNPDDAILIKQIEENSTKDLTLPKEIIDCFIDCLKEYKEMSKNVYCNLSRMW